MNKVFLLLVVAFALSAGPAYSHREIGLAAADSAHEDPFDSRSYFMAGLRYLTNYVYLGRKDTARVPFINPYLQYQFKSGVYLKAGAFYAPAYQTVDLTSFTVGYDHSFGDDFDAGISIDRYNFHKKVVLVNSDITTNVSVYGQYNNDWVTPMLTFDSYFGTSTDYVLGLTAFHEFGFANNRLNVTPLVIMNSGTQHFYDQFFLKRHADTANVNNEAVFPKRFLPLDFEINTTVSYWVSKWLFTLVATYAIPVNPSTVTILNRTFKEELSNSFYLELEVCFR